MPPNNNELSKEDLQTYCNTIIKQLENAVQVAHPQSYSQHATAAKKQYLDTVKEL